MDLTLVIMAAGIGSRYGGIKQLDSVGPSGETIMDYSIYDAIRSGYNKVVFIIRKELKEAFDIHYKSRFKNKIAFDYVYQDEFKKYEDLYEINRSKPWGTGHAMLSTAKVINEPFAILNADDFYGPQAFQIMAEAQEKNKMESTFFLLGYKLINTLSEYGTVSRGLCKTDKDNYLIDIKELTKIGRKNGEIYFEANNTTSLLQPNDLVSMNFWGFTPWVFGELENTFRTFIKENHTDPKAEFYIPTFVNHLIKTGKAKVRVLSTDETWLGVTYKEDKPKVEKGIRKMIQEGFYPEEIK